VEEGGRGRRRRGIGGSNKREEMGVG
jgi:hypothetical protein